MGKKTILVICGPTASGKTSFALDIAKRLPNVNILSVDSRQMYKNLDIVTGKDIPHDLPKHIKFFGLDLISPDSTFNLSDFVQYARNVFKESNDANTPLIVVGGTGLYLKAITSDFFNIKVPPDPKLRNKLEEKSVTELQKILLKINSEKYSSLNESDIKNPRRLIRAIEVTKSVQPTPTGSERILPGQSPEFIWIGLNPNKETIKTNIRLRVIQRLDSGALEEVKSLLGKYPDTKLPIYTSLGVKEIIEYLNSKISRDQLIDQWAAKEVDYARRQLVWFKKQSGIIWYDKSKINRKLIDKLASKLKND